MIHKQADAVTKQIAHEHAKLMLRQVANCLQCSMRLVCSDTDGASWDLENELVVYATEESHREMQSKGDYSSFFDSAEGTPRPRPSLRSRQGLIKA